MPLIPYPDIPMLAGVPPLPRTSTQFLPTQVKPLQQGADTQAELTSVSKNVYAIVYAGGDSALDFDSILDFEYKNERRIPIYPIEQGGFESYNKVSLPFDIRLTVTCGGYGLSSKDGFLSICDELINSTDLLDVITPDAVFSNVNLTHYDYRREARSGVSLLIVQLWFQEIRTSAITSIGTAIPDAQAPVNNGQVTPVAATPNQNAQVAK